MLGTMIVALGLVLGGLAVAQDPAPSGRGPMGPRMMMHGSPCPMGHGCAMGHGAMGMGCPMMAPDTDLKVEKLENGVSITLTSSDPKAVARIQKRAEIMRLMRELKREEP
jgi:hypothetical protein